LPEYWEELGAIQALLEKRMAATISAGESKAFPTGKQ
jgi:hypothetical protein